MDVQLWAKNPTLATYTNLDLLSEQPIKLTLSVQNIQDPLAANSVFSRTFRVPHTSINGPFFKAVFNVNSTDFDASVKCDAYINDNGVYFSSGNIRLSAIYVNEQTNNIEYEINYYGETSDFGSKIGGGFLSQVNLSEYNHEQTYVNITNSWVGSLFNGDIVYPLVEWGYTYEDGSPMQPTLSKYGLPNSAKGVFGPAGGVPYVNALRQSQFKPAIRAKALWDKIFDETGYTYSSTFLNSQEFLNLYIVAEDKARAILEANQTFGATSTISQTDYSGGTYDAYFDNEVYDFSNQFNPATSVYTAGSNGNYVFSFNGSFVAPLMPIYRSIGVWAQLVDATTGSLLASTSGPAVITNVAIGPSPSADISAYFSAVLTAGQKVRIRVQYSALAPADVEVPVTMFAQTFDCYDAPENVNVSSIMPSNIRKIDFMRSIINRFRLVFVPSKDNANKFEITPWKDWILQGNSLDWTSKLDGSKDMKITPLFYGQDRLQIYKDQEDADFVNYNYQLDFKQTYGQKNLDSNNELIKGVKTVQDQFAPTPLWPLGNVAPTDPLYAVQIPHLAKDTNTERQPIQPKLRLLYYNGLQALPTGTRWRMEVDYGISAELSSYPLMSQYSSWPVSSSTFDLAWENEPPLFETNTIPNPPDPANLWLLPTSRTTLDQFNVYWKTWYDVTFDPYSRIVEANILLDWGDVINLKFNDYIFVKDAWYFVNKITDYISGQTTNCKVELVKIGNQIGLTLPVVNPFTFYPNSLCFGETKCNAFCCKGSRNVYYTNGVTLDSSSFIYTDAYGSIPATAGYYSDGLTIALVGTLGQIISFAINDCSCVETRYPFEICVGETLCEACCCIPVALITIWGENPDFYANTQFWTTETGSTPVADGWYKLVTGASHPYQSVHTVNGTVDLNGLCETNTGCDPTSCTTYQMYSLYGGAIDATLCGEELPVGIPIPSDEVVTICAVTGSVSVAIGSVTITALPYWNPTCNCTPGPTYTPYEFKYAATLCDACCDGTKVTLWLQDPETPLDGSVFYADALGNTTASAGYYKYGADVIQIDAFGAYVATFLCDDCACDFFYVAENCSEQILQNFSYPTPLTPGTVVSSNLFADQCWTILGPAQDGYPIDFIYSTCNQCLGIENPCDCYNYEIKTQDVGGTIQYINCATQAVVYEDLLPNTTTTRCACRNSIIVLEGIFTIVELGPCEEALCTTYELYSLEGGAVDATICGETLPVGVPINAGETLRICAVTGSVSVAFGTVSITAQGACQTPKYNPFGAKFLGTSEIAGCVACDDNDGTLLTLYGDGETFATSTEVHTNVEGTTNPTNGWYKDLSGNLYLVTSGFVSVFNCADCPGPYNPINTLYINTLDVSGCTACCDETGTSAIVYGDGTTLANSTRLYSDDYGTAPATSGYYRDIDNITYVVDALGFITAYNCADCPPCASDYRILYGNAGMRSLDSVTGTQITNFGGSNPLEILVEQTDNKIVSVRQMTRYNFDGTQDLTFDNINIANGVIYGAAKIGGNYYFAGAFTTSKGNTVNKIAAVNNVGAYVNMTSRGTGFGAAVNQVSLIGHNGSLYVYRNTTGSTTYNGTPCQNLLKMNTNGLITQQFNIGTSNVSIGTEPVWDSLGNMYVITGGSSGFITKFSPTGVSLGEVSLGSVAIRGIVIDSLDRIYVCASGAITVNGTATSKTMVRLNTSLVYDATFGLPTKNWRQMFLENDTTMYAVYVGVGETVGRVNKINLATQTIDSTFVSPAVGSYLEQYSLNAYTIV